MECNFVMYPMWYPHCEDATVTIDPDKVYWADLSPFERVMLSKGRSIGVEYIFYRTSTGTSFLTKLKFPWKVPVFDQDSIVDICKEPYFFNNKN